jgi:glycerophosphoryl diester phosphodiesterase
MEKHVLFEIDSQFTPSLNVFTGDLPYIISYNNEEGLSFYLKLYAMFYMLPQELNFYIKFSENPECGYIDEYSKITLFRQIYFGTDKFEDYFIGISSKINNETFGFKLYNTGKFSTYYGINLKPISVDLSYKNGINLNIDYRFKDFYTLNFKYSNGKFYFGFGISWFNTNFYDLNEKNAKYFAHRGQLNKYPENSRVAFVNTLKDNKYIGIETDINETKDGKYAVIHDPFMFRFTGSLRMISSYTMEELKKIDVSPYFHYSEPIHIMELKDIAPLFKGSKKILLIEVKSCGRTKEDVVKFLDYVDKYFPSNINVWFSSLDPFWVREIKKFNTRKNSEVFYIYPFLMVSQSDYVYPSIDSEFKEVIDSVNPDGIIWFKPKTDLFYQIEKLSKKYKINMLYWDFANKIYFYNYKNN